MLIVFGTQSSLIKKEITPDVCVHCGESNCIEMSVKQGFVHIFFIPIAPADKIVVSECTNCQEVLIHNRVVGPYRQSYERLITQVKTPLWTYAGTAIMAVSVLGGIGFQFFKAEKSKAMISNPRAGDIYEIKEGVAAYTLYKVAAVTDDSLYFLINDSVVPLQSKLPLLKQRSFSRIPVSISIQDLQGMAKTDQILGVEKEAR
jgi:hypothetical protein